MPPPIPVELIPHDPAWSVIAQRESMRLAALLGERLITVHHIGSTAITGIRAKPIVDLLPVVDEIAALNAIKDRLEALGFGWWGEYGLPGRRYCTRDDALSGRRLIQLHCFARGSPEIVRHVAFRDYLRANPEIARAYDAEKGRCRDLHPSDSHAYNDCKSDVVKQIEADSLRHYLSPPVLADD